MQKFFDQHSSTNEVSLTSLQQPQTSRYPPQERHILSFALATECHHLSCMLVPLYVKDLIFHRSFPRSMMMMMTTTFHYSFQLLFVLEGLGTRALSARRTPWWCH